MTNFKSLSNQFFFMFDEMHLKPQDIDLVLSKIYDMYAMQNREHTQTNEFIKIGYPQAYIEDIFKYIKIKKPYFIELTIPENGGYGTLASIFEFRRDEVKTFLDQGGFTNEFNIVSEKGKVRKRNQILRDYLLVGSGSIAGIGTLGLALIEILKYFHLKSVLFWILTIHFATCFFVFVSGILFSIIIYILLWSGKSQKNK